MKLACTKKLLDYLELKPEKISENTDPLYEWTANLIVVNRRKTLVAVHVASRSLFVLHGLTAKTRPTVRELILDGIRAMLESEYVHPQIIEQYLNDCGREVVFQANTSRSVVTTCNKACEWVKGYADLFEPGDLLQKRILPRLNDNLAPRGTHSFAHEALLGMLRDRYGEDIQSCRMAELDVELALHNPCRRVIRVPADLNLYQLHRVLQGIFEWHNCHLHQFVTKRDQYGRPTEVLSPGNGQDEWEDLYDVERMDSTAVTVEELFSVYRQVDYEYDFGDDWQYTIRLQRFIEDCSQVQPHCILAVGDAPMEDCGGARGFAEVMAILNNPSHPEHREYTEWVRGTWWQPLDVERINRRLRNACRRSIPSEYELGIW